jgi:hypothetical protein
MGMYDKSECRGVESSRNERGGRVVGIRAWAWAWRREDGGVVEELFEGLDGVQEPKEIKLVRTAVCHPVTQPAEQPLIPRATPGRGRALAPAGCVLFTGVNGLDRAPWDRGSAK